MLNVHLSYIQKLNIYVNIFIYYIIMCHHNYAS